EERGKEIERLKGGQGEPVYQTCNRVEGWIDVDRIRYTACSLDPEEYETRTLFASPPAPVAVVLPDREVMRDLIAEIIGGDTYDCTRVWSAWGVGTMSEDDFVPFTDQDERLYELADACLDKVKELNQ